MAFYEMYKRFTIVLMVIVSVRGQRCSFLKTNGYTVPQGDIVLEYGSALNITCNLNKTIVDEYGPNASSRLYFQRNDTPISPEMVQIINSTSSTLYIENHPKTKEDNYFCYFNGTKDHKEMICLNVVKVGVAPLNVTDFSCISRNCDNFTCTWTPPENYVTTHYSLTYQINVRQSRKNKTKGICHAAPESNDWAIYTCESIKKLHNGQLSCFWNVKTSPQYRPVHECYYFQLSMNNTFGSNVNSIVFNHFTRVLPNPPENLTSVATSPHSINLTWTIPTSMVTFSPGLDHRILFQCEYYEKVWQFGGLKKTQKNTKTVTYALENLKYAHALCDIRVSMRSSVADQNDDSMWSQNATRTIRTKSKIPDGPPKTVTGSFEINDSKNGRNVYIYWQQLKEEQYNGENLTYVAKIRNKPSRFESAKAYVLLENLDYSEYVIDIWSENVIGQSSEKSVVIIPAKTLDKPPNFIKEHSGNTYVLSWQSPQESESLITNYTVFWCHHDMERPYQCPGPLNWEVVPKNIKRYTKSMPATNLYQFAISANYVNNTSGMLWAECTVIPDKSRDRIDNAWIINAKSDYIKVGWSLDCLNRISTIQGYIIFYCQMESPQQTDCKAGTQKNVTIEGDVNLQSGVVTGLTPCSSYRLQISYMLNNSIYSQPSKPLRNTTSEAAPETPPHNVTVISKSNSSISLTWQPPTKISCYLKHYNIYYNDKMTNTSETEITLTNLSSYTKYDISIEACTTRCSMRSENLAVVTEKWLPGKMKEPNLHNNESHMTISWDKPNPPGGEISYYQLRIKDSRDMEDAPIINVTAQNYTMEGCASGKQKDFYISVRAVNVINNVPKPGPWSTDSSNTCAPYPSVVPIVVCSLVIFLLVAMACGFKKLYGCFKEGRKFVPKLPPGLEPDAGLENDEEHCYKTKDMDLRPPADAQHLLQKNNETRLSGDSSGCSSGHESITSSLESTAHISPSDSGTEQPRSPSLHEEVRKNSLRQRNVSAPRPTINIGYVTADTIPLANLTPKPVTPSPGNYCVLGVDPSSTPQSDAAYVPIFDMNTKLPISCNLPEAPPPYVMTGDLIKSTNPGYVPHTATAPVEKNMGYVVAGLSKDLLASNLLQCDTPKPALSEENPHYIRASETIPTLKPMFHWPSPQVALPKTGYVSVGDAPPPKPLTEVTKGYVSHRQFEGKSLKED